ncbi:DUF397 domain-containing protein [Streptomyces sp. NPDC059122]|uniref:DUF397 domain-containing protein n=1 Tax=Streptomyces sp. NPDC059122 TaxID=3346732 RepID=UPI00369F8301
MSRDLGLASVEWIKSSYSEGNGGACLEFSPTPTPTPTHALVPLRDSKCPGGPVITVSVTGWSSFVDAVKNGEFAV